MKRLAILMSVCLALLLSGCSVLSADSNTDVNETVSSGISCLETGNENYPYTAKLDDHPEILISAKSEEALNEILNLIIHSEINQALSGGSQSSNAEDIEEKNYSTGENAYVETEYGNYYFSVKEVTVLPETSYRDAVYQITWEYENESFSVPNGTLLCIDSGSFSVTDSNGYVVSPMSTGWEGEWANYCTPIDIGKNASLS